MGVQLAAGQPSLMEEANYSDLELAYRVQDALRLVPTGDNEHYEELLGVLHRKQRLCPDEVALLVTSLKAISGAVSSIDIVHHRTLLMAVCNMSLWTYGPDVMDAIVELVVSLAASSGKYVDLCLSMLVSNFVPPSWFLESLKQPRGLAKKEQVLIHVHSALKDIADLVPLSPVRLEQIIREKVQIIYYKEPMMIVLYAENMLKLESGAMGELVGNSMLLELVNKLIDLDVEIGWDEILQDDPSKGIFEMELEDMEEPLDDIEIDMDEPPKEYSGRKVLWGNVIAEKLDRIMVLFFEHLKSCHESGRLVQVFEVLLQSFQCTVLNAYKSKFAQFVMFYACSLDPEDCGLRFVSMLFDIFTNGVYPQDWRISAVAYLASYLSRAKFLSASYVFPILESLVDWCSKYCEGQKGETTNPQAHRVFYAGSQAIMYVLCFRMRSILTVPRLKSQLFLLPIETILKHPLNPLEVCLPSIVEEFLHQAKAVKLFRVSEAFSFYGLLESESSRAFGGLERLDMFFPFDPYLLKKSDRFIRPNFNFWSLVRTTYDDDDDDDDNEGSSDEDDAKDVNDIEDGGMAISYEDGLEFDKFDLSMNQMSITPQDSSLRYRFGGESQGMQRMPSRIRPSTSPESL